MRISQLQLTLQVDVGFGNNVPTRPLPLEENKVSINIAPSEMRLIKEPLPESVDQTQKFWIYQIRFSSVSVWIPIYAFSEVEFLPQDFAMMNYQTYQLPSSWFTQMFVCVQLILDDAGEELKGLYILAGKEVKRRVHGETETVDTLESEADRVRALEKWFGMRLLDHEIAGINGLGSSMR
jgi:arylamine N-acetyltransferase